MALLHCAVRPNPLHTRLWSLTSPIPFPMLSAVRGKLRIVLLSALGVAILILLVFCGSLAWRSPSYPPLPQPNGYDDFIKAGRLLSGPQIPYSTMPADSLRHVLATNAEVLRLCRLGLSRTCSVPTETFITNFAGAIPDFSKLKHVADVLAAEARLAELEHRPQDAAVASAELIKMGNAISRGGCLIHRLVGVAIEAMGATRLVLLVGQLNPEQARPVILLLSETEGSAVNWDEVARVERQFARHELGAVPNPVRAIAAWWTQRATMARARARHESCLAHRRLLLLELALRCYKAETGRTPAKLDELVPKYLPTIPSDPFGGRPLVYRKQGATWLLYSIGPDLVDNGGVPGPRGLQKGDIVYSSSW